MKKKHFIEIAKILKDNRAMIETMNSREIALHNASIDCIAFELDTYFQTINPLYDSDRFLQATDTEI